MKKKDYTKLQRIIFIISLAGLLIIIPAGRSKYLLAQSNTNKSDTPVVTPVLKPIEGFHVYENPEAGIRIQYPENWDKKEGENGVVFFIPKKTAENAVYEGYNLLFEEMCGMNLSLDKYLEITIDGMKKYMPGFHLIESSKRSLGGHPAYQLLYLGTHESQDMKFFSMFAIRKGIVYALSFNTLFEQFDAYKDTYEKITGSFEFLY